MHLVFYFLFKEAFRDIVPNEILDERIKLGYACTSLPEVKISKDLNQKIKNLIRNEYLDLEKFLNPILENDENSSIILDKKNWRIINFIFWMFNYMDL